MTDSRLKTKYGPWALVTGASSGIGRAFAEALAGYGFNLLLVPRRAAELHEAAVRAEMQAGVEAQTLSADLTTTEGIELVRSQSQGRNIGLLVASAGFGTSGPFLAADPDMEAEMLDVNCRALMLLTHEFGNRMKARGSGGIILMSSLLAWQGVPCAAHYAATKAYVQVFAEALACELKPHRVDVLASTPGPVFSGFGERANMRLTMGITPRTVAAESLKALGRKTTVVPGTVSRMLTGSLAPLPRWLRVRVMGRVMADMTKNANKPIPKKE